MSIYGNGEPEVPYSGTFTILQFVLGDTTDFLFQSIYRPFLANFSFNLHLQAQPHHQVVWGRQAAAAWRMKHFGNIFAIFCQMGQFVDICGRDGAIC